MLKRGDDLNEALRDAIEEWQPVREKTIPELREFATKVNHICKKVDSPEDAHSGTKGVFGKFIDEIKDLVTPDHESKIDDKVIAELNIEEVQKQEDDDHAATRKVLNIIHEIEQLVHQMTHLKTQAKKNEMLSILLNIDPGAVGEAADKGTGVVIDIGEIGQEIAKVGKKMIDFGETSMKIGGVGAKLGRVTGWIPGVGEATSKTKQTAEVATKTGSVAISVGNLLEDLGDGFASMTAKVGELVLRLGNTSPQPANVGIQMNVFPLNIEQIVRSGLTVSVDESDIKASHDLREKADEYEKQMKAILIIVNEGITEA